MTYKYLNNSIKKISSLIGDRTLFVIGHQIPDVDSYVSSLLLAKLLKKEGINAVPAIVVSYDSIDQITKSVIENTKCERIDMHNITDIDYVFLVDHNDPYESCKRIQPKNVLGIVDHHEDNKVDATLKIIRQSGSTGKLIYKMYKTLGHPMTDDEEVQILYSLLTDTCGLLTNRAGSDDKVFAEKLCRSLNIDLSQCMKESIFETDLNKPMLELMKNGYKEYFIDNKKITSSGIEFLGDNDKTQTKVKRITNYMLSQKNKMGECYCHIFILRDFSNEKTTSYYICAENTHENVYHYIASRGSTILPDFKKWLNS